MELDGLRDPQRVAFKAQGMGMVIPATPAFLRLADGKVAVTVEVAKKKLADKLGTPTGKVVLMTEDGEIASKKVKLDKDGQAVLKPKKKFAGEKLVVLYLGGGKLGSDTVVVKG